MTDLRELMERAVADAPHDSLMPAEVLGAAQRDLRRRTAWLTAGVAAVAVVVIGLTWSLVVPRADREPPVLDNPVDGTPGALAAVALGHLDVSASEVQGGRGGDFYPVGARWATMKVAEPGRSREGILTVAASPSELSTSDCERADGCAEVETRVGTVNLSWTEDMDLGNQGVVSVQMRRGDEWLIVVWTGHGVTGDPRTDDLTITVDDLVSIVTDPAFGLETSAAAAERGQELIPE